MSPRLNTVSTLRRAAGTLILCITSILHQGCNKQTPLEVTSPSAYQYKAYDTTGALIVQGWFTLTIQDSSHVEGDWHFAQVNHPQNTGPQTGNGRLYGYFFQGDLILGLNPTYADNNVMLFGTISGNSYSGTWSWDTFIGRTNWGTFTATK